MSKKRRWKFVCNKEQGYMIQQQEDEKHEKEEEKEEEHQQQEQKTTTTRTRTTTFYDDCSKCQQPIVVVSKFDEAHGSRVDHHHYHSIQQQQQQTSKKWKWKLNRNNNNNNHHHYQYHRNCIHTKMVFFIVMFMFSISITNDTSLICLRLIVVVVVSADRSQHLVDEQRIHRFRLQQYLQQQQQDQKNNNNNIMMMRGNKNKIYSVGKLIQQSCSPILLLKQKQQQQQQQQDAKNNFSKDRSRVVMNEQKREQQQQQPPLPIGEIKKTIISSSPPSIVVSKDTKTNSNKGSSNSLLDHHHQDETQQQQQPYYHHHNNNNDSYFDDYDYNIPSWGMNNFLGLDDDMERNMNKRIQLQKLYDERMMLLLKQKKNVSWFLLWKERFFSLFFKSTPTSSHPEKLLRQEQQEHLKRVVPYSWSSNGEWNTDTTTIYNHDFSVPVASSSSSEWHYFYKDYKIKKNEKKKNRLQQHNNNLPIQTTKNHSDNYNNKQQRMNHHYDRKNAITNSSEKNNRNVMINDSSTSLIINSSSVGTFLKLLWVTNQVFFTNGMFGTMLIVLPLYISQRLIQLLILQPMQDWYTGRYLRISYMNLEKQYKDAYYKIIPASIRSISRITTHIFILFTLGKIMEYMVGLQQKPCLHILGGGCHWWCGILWMLSVIGTGHSLSSALAIWGPFKIQVRDHDHAYHVLHSSSSTSNTPPPTTAAAAVVRHKKNGNGNGNGGSQSSSSWLTPSKDGTNPNTGGGGVGSNSSNNAEGRSITWTTRRYGRQLFRRSWTLLHFMLDPDQWFREIIASDRRRKAIAAASAFKSFDPDPYMFPATWNFIRFFQMIGIAKELYINNNGIMHSFMRQILIEQAFSDEWYRVMMLEKRIGLGIAVMVGYLYSTMNLFWKVIRKPVPNASTLTTLLMLPSVVGIIISAWMNILVCVNSNSNTVVTKEKKRRRQQQEQQLQLQQQKESHLESDGGRNNHFLSSTSSNQMNRQQLSTVNNDNYATAAAEALRVNLFPTAY